jgi:hypothetical protein
VTGWRNGFVLTAAVAVTVLAMPPTAVAQGMVLFIEFGRDNPHPIKPSAAVNTLQDLARALSGCWSPPPIDRDVGPVDVTFQVSFKRSGELFGKPKVVTFVQKVTPELRDRYYRAVAETLERCAQMPFTEQMGGAVAGRPFRVNFIDKRAERRAESTWPTTTTN